MSWKRVTLGTIVLALCAGGLRFGARRLRGKELSHQSSSACGSLVRRATTTTRQGPFDSVPELVSSANVLELEGRVIVTDVGDLACLSRGGSLLLGMTAAIVRNVDGHRADVSILSASSGEVERVVHFDHDVQTTAWSEDGDWFAAIGTNGEISATQLTAARPAVVLARDKPPVGKRVAWSPDATSACWVTARPPAGGVDGSAELWCSKVPEPPASAARAIWTGSDVAVPWPAFAGKKPHLCGEDLKPRDVGCTGLTRGR